MNTSIKKEMQDFTAFLELAGVHEPERIKAGNKILNALLSQLCSQAIKETLNSLEGKIKKGMNRLFEKYKPEGTTRADEDWQQREFIKTQKREVLNEVLSLLQEIKEGK